MVSGRFPACCLVSLARLDRVQMQYNSEMASMEQALVENLTLMTSDPLVARYPAPIRSV